MRQFHLALPINTKENVIEFYLNVLELPVKILNEEIFFVDFFGTNLAFNFNKDYTAPELFSMTKKDIEEARKNYLIKSFHFGALISKKEFDQLILNCKKHNIKFIIEPNIINEGKHNEQFLAFILGPCDHIIEIRSISEDFKLENISEFAQQLTQHENKKYI
ncbi:MAG: hypothetical protein ACK4OM_02450 [Alphaproteobacteria bacterium]